jgi:transcriptional regulator GlxA family with amidase domain
MSIKDDKKRASKEERKRASKETLRRKNAQSRGVPDITIHDPRVRMVIDFMRANLQRKLSLMDFARAVNLSAAHLSRLFKTETGLSPGEYLIRLRMEKARSLLTSSLLSIKEIMALAGYRNRSHFVQHFRRYSGLAPSEFRKGLSRY